MTPSRMPWAAAAERGPDAGSPSFVISASMRATSSKDRASWSYSEGDSARVAATMRRTSAKASFD
mgnify:CR=1 FL=1